MKSPMQSLRREQQFRQRQRMNPPNLLPAPIVPHGIGIRSDGGAVSGQERPLPNASPGIVAQNQDLRGAQGLVALEARQTRGPLFNSKQFELSPASSRIGASTTIS
jgi:hypothetical protein